MRRSYYRRVEELLNEGFEMEEVLVEVPVTIYVGHLHTAGWCDLCVTQRRTFKFNMHAVSGEDIYAKAVINDVRVRRGQSAPREDDIWGD